MQADIAQALTGWGLESLTIREDVSVPGSPERCVVRYVLEDASSALWVLERLFPKQHERRESIGRALAELHTAGLPVLAYRQSESGSFVVEADNFHWQLAPYVQGDPLPQPDFVDDEERGKNLGTFLVQLRNAGAKVADLDHVSDFNLAEYVAELMATIKTREPQLHGALEPVLPVLSPLFEQWDRLPRALCHGDYHPLNVIWQGMGIGAVIDWEFAGPRPVLYDAANCLGCVGIEDPHALNKGLAPAMLETMSAGGVIDAKSLELFPHLLLGLRFAWMSEWLRRKDKEMQSLECDYMNLLARSVDGLGRIWERFSK